jgi:hypothetical protein
VADGDARERARHEPGLLGRREHSCRCRAKRRTPLVSRKRAQRFTPEETVVAGGRWGWLHHFQEGRPSSTREHSVLVVAPLQPPERLGRQEIGRILRPFSGAEKNLQNQHFREDVVSSRNAC